MSVLHNRLLGLALGLIGATGCTYIGQDAFNAQLCEVDEDGDGDPWLQCSDEGVRQGIRDCDDADPEIYTGAEEVPYDGIDQDCDADGADLLDVDGDGYPAISQAEFDQIGGGASWPPELPDEVDCDDADDSIYPGAPDQRYDGIDHDCGGGDDYDGDGDGWIPAAYADEYEGEGQIGDCDDNREDVNPGVPSSEDEHYDGVDNDCAGNNDFDADGDTWMSETALVGDLEKEEWRGFFHEYEAFYGYDFPDKWGDCREQSDPNLVAAGLGPEDVYGAAPGSKLDLKYGAAPDVWYDGVDADCAGNNDFDADGDGFMPDEATHAAKLAEFEKYWGTVDAEWGDCDDDPESAVAPTVKPRALERLGDAIDQDCDGGVDTTAVAVSPDEWLAPRPPVVGATDSDYLLVSSADELVDAADGSVRTNVGWFLLFGDAPEWKPGSEGDSQWQGGALDPIGDVVDAVFTSDAFYAVNGSLSLTKKVGESDLNVITVVEMRLESGKYDESAKADTVTGADPASHFADLDLRLSADEDLWVLGANESFVYYGYVPVGGASLQFESRNSADLGPDSVVGVFVDPPDAGGAVGQGHVCDSAGCTTLALNTSLDSISVAPSQLYSSWPSAGVETREDLLVRMEPAAGLTVIDGVDEWFLLGEHEVLHSDAIWHDGLLYVAAAVADVDGDGADDVVLAYGDPATEELVEVLYPMTDGTELWTATGASIYVDDERVFLGMSGEAMVGTPADTVAWVFLGHG